MNQLHVTGKQKIGNFEFIGIEGGFGEDKKAMTVKDIAEIHSQPQGKINERINGNRGRFIDGVDIIDLKPVIPQKDIEKFGFTQNAWNRLINAYILSERGYFKLLKILEDDTAWEIYDQLVDNYFTYRKTVKSIDSDLSDLDIKRMNATARLENARVRKAKLYAELSENATTKVNRVLLQDKAVETLSGKKLLEMPKMKQKLLDCKTIAEKLGIHTKNGDAHTTAVSQLIQCHIQVDDNESEIVPFFNGHKSGTMMNYSESVVEKVRFWLEANNYPSKIKGTTKNYHVWYEF